ncbi:MAG: response regulator [Deltaproteobacteria bacterium]|nr:response regulator [Deltaproteobacteria bacterium]
MHADASHAQPATAPVGLHSADLSTLLVGEHRLLARGLAIGIGATMVAFLLLDPWVMASQSSPLAGQVLPMIRATRVGALVLCAALWPLDRALASGRISHRTGALALAAWLGLAFHAMALLLGWFGWFQPTTGYYVAAVLFLGLAVKVPALWSGGIFGAGMAGMLVPHALHPGGWHAESASSATDVLLMSATGCIVAHLGFRRRRQSWQDQATIARQNTELHEANRRLSDALQVAEQRGTAALAAERAKGAFLARMSHEIRTPLHGIIGMTELALAESAAGPQQAQLASVYASATGLLGVVNEVLEFSRLEAGQAQMQRVPFDAADLLRELVAALAPVAAKRDTQLRVGPCPAELPALGDPFRVRQVLNNLIDNALKFSPGGCVTVGVQLATPPAGRQLEFDVSDTGVGIAPDRLAAIFEPFEQADPGVAGRFGGTGLGLAISARLVAAMGGRITATSEVGKGSTFQVILPQRNETVPTAPEHQTPLPAEPMRPLKVLLAEDNAVNAEIARLMLARAGHQVEVVGDGRAALAALADGRFDIVLMDLQMPEMDGADATRALRQREEGSGRRTPVVALTAHSAEEIRETIRDGGFDGYLCKPFTARQLMELLARMDAAISELELRGESANGPGL